MSLILATGSNLGDSLAYLEEAKLRLSHRYHLIAASRIYRSAAVDYEAQPDFLNQVLEFKLPALTPEECLNDILELERAMGRKREILRGPRTIDIDILFWGKLNINSEQLVIPHPRWMERSFVVRPLQELPFFQTIEKWFTIPGSFTVEAFPLA